MEIFRWMFLFEPIGVRYFVPILLLQVGRVDDAYNLTKFLMFNYAKNSDEDLQVLIKKKDWLASLPKHDTTEGILLGRYLWYYHGYLIDFCLKCHVYLFKLKWRQADQNWAFSWLLIKRDSLFIMQMYPTTFIFTELLADFSPTCIFHMWTIFPTNTLIWHFKAKVLFFETWTLLLINCEILYWSFISNCYILQIYDYFILLFRKKH